MSWPDFLKMALSERFAFGLLVLAMSLCIVSVAFAWSELAGRSGALIVGTALYLDLRFLRHPATHFDDARILPGKLIVKDRHIGLFVGVPALIGTVMWAFGDWLTCSIHAPGWSTCTA